MWPPTFSFKLVEINNELQSELMKLPGDRKAAKEGTDRLMTVAAAAVVVVADPLGFGLLPTTIYIF